MTEPFKTIHLPNKRSVPNVIVQIPAIVDADDKYFLVQLTVVPKPNQSR
jgi:hypothetical protein